MSEQPEEKKRYFRVSELKERIFETKNESFSKGWSTGFKELDEIISYKKGYSTVVYSYSHQGKTQFAIEESIHLAKTYGVVTLLYLTEAGTMGDTILDIIQTYLGKNLGEQMVDDSEIFTALEWMDKYFVILDCEASLLTIRQIYQEVRRIKRETGLVVENVIIDHYGNLQKGDDQKFLKIDENVKYVLQAVTRTSKSLGFHTFILFHVRDTDPIKCKISEKFYLPKPEHYDISGGQQVNFLGQQMICIWRPISAPEKFGIVNPDTCMPYEMNETHVTVSKSKPKHIGRLGTRTIYFETSRQRYYEKIDSRPYYAREYAEAHDTPPVKMASGAIQPNTNFDTPTQRNKEIVDIDKWM